MKILRDMIKKSINHFGYGIHKLQYEQQRHNHPLTNRTKIFCIGRNKTGTTSISKALNDMGFKVGDHIEAEWMFENWVTREFSCLKKYCDQADAFQDVPFSLQYTYIYLDQIFPDSKFILSIRDSAEQWYNSIVNFHAKLWASDGKMPTAEDLKKADYLYRGFPYRGIKTQFNTSDDDLYNKEKFITEYNTHNDAVMDYFKNKPGKLLVLNVGEKDAYQKFCTFLNKKPLYSEFPWELKTQNLP